MEELDPCRTRVSKVISEWTVGNMVMQGYG